MNNILTDEELTHLFSLFQNSENTFINKAVKALPDIMYVMNLDSYVIIYSSRLVALELGYSSREVQKMEHPLLDIMHPDDRPKFIQHLELVKNSLNNEVIEIEFRLIHHNGTISWYIDRNTIFTRHLDGMPATKIGITHNVTEKKEHEERLLKRDSIIEQSEVLAKSGSWEYSPESKNFYWSPGMYRLFNLPEGTHIKPSIYQEYCTITDRAIADRIVTFIEETQEPFEEVLHIDVNGRIRCLNIKAAPVQGTIHSRIMVGVDVDSTLIEEYELKLKKMFRDLQVSSRRMQVLHSDLKTFSHIAAVEYNTNLKFIYTAFEKVVSGEAANFSNHGKASIRKIQSALQKMNLLTGDILRYLAIEIDERRIERVSLDDLVHHVLVDLKETINFEDVVVEKYSLGSHDVDFHLTYLLFRNLIDNAVKFRNQSIPLTIKLSSYQVSDEDYDSSEDGITAPFAIVIEDNGIGFNPEEKEKLFELFYKNHYDQRLKGSGIGLSIARKIMQLHGGRIDGEGVPGRSAKFTCFFPGEN